MNPIPYTIRPEDLDRVLAETEDLRAEHHILVLPKTHDHHPSTMVDLEYPPTVLFAIGNTSLLVDESRKVAVVGARAATEYGNHQASEISRGLADRGVTIVSGGAYGIDAAAHHAALSVGGKTIVVLAGGLDRTYPAGHDNLFRRVVDNGGVLVSEVAPGDPPHRYRFLARNRLIAAIADGTFVVEAGIKSGSLSTVRHSLALGRPTWAMPGPVTSPASSGTNLLLRDEPRVRAAWTAQQIHEDLVGAGL